jgi:hypothetical protein
MSSKSDHSTSSFASIRDRRNQHIALKKRTRLSSTYRPYVCGCGKSYQSYPAIYTHAKNKHGGHITDGSYHLKNGMKRPIKSSKCAKTGLKQDKPIAGRVHFSAKFYQNQKLKDLKSQKVSGSNLQLAPIEHKADSKIKSGRQEQTLVDGLRPTIVSLLEQNGLKCTTSVPELCQLGDRQTVLTQTQEVQAVLNAIEPRVFPSHFCACKHIVQSLQEIINEKSFEKADSSKQTRGFKHKTIYQLFAKFLVFLKSFIEDDTNSKAFLCESFLMLCLLCQTLNLYGFKEENSAGTSRSGGCCYGSDKPAYIGPLEEEINIGCRKEKEYCSDPSSKLSVLTKLMPGFLALYFPCYWSQLLK